MLLECNNCEAIVDAEVIAERSYETREELQPPWEEPPVEITLQAAVRLVSCPRCNHPMLVYSDEFKPDFVRLYPPMDRDLHPSVPNPIRQAFQEARTCLRAKAFTAAAIMCRKTLEGICSAHGVKSKTLAVELKELKDKGVIENRLFEWAEELRTIGNEAAHDVAFVASREDARDTLEFTEALIEYVFTYRDKFEEFKKRRAKATPPPREAPTEKQKGGSQ
jgi:hypothetical protein